MNIAGALFNGRFKNTVRNIEDRLLFNILRIASGNDMGRRLSALDCKVGYRLAGIQIQQ